jgi:hypothetical protein
MGRFLVWEVVVCELIEYAEKAGIDNMRERIDVAITIQREANTVMALLLAGAGAALAFAAHDNGDSIGITGAAIFVSLYLFFLAALLNWKCLGLIAYPACCNVPKNLNKPEYTVEQIRNWELENLQVRIDQALVINERRSGWLNCCRYAATLTPLIAIFGWGAACLAADAGLVFAAQAVVLGFLQMIS